jgi:hypothetical protein
MALHNLNLFHKKGLKGYYSPDMPEKGFLSSLSLQERRYPKPRQPTARRHRPTERPHRQRGAVPAASTRCPLDSVTSSERRVT